MGRALPDITKIRRTRREETEETGCPLLEARGLGSCLRRRRGRWRLDDRQLVLVLVRLWRDIGLYMAMISDPKIVDQVVALPNPKRDCLNGDGVRYKRPILSLARFFGVDSGKELARCCCCSSRVAAFGS